MKNRRFLSLLLGLFMAQSFLASCAKQSNEMGANSASDVPPKQDITEQLPESETVVGNDKGKFQTPQTLSDSFSSSLTNKYLKEMESDRMQSLGVSANDYVNVIVSLKGDSLLDRYLNSEFGGEVAEYVLTDGNDERVDMLAMQESVRNSITKIDNRAEYSYSYTLAQNGFAARVRYGALDEIRQLPTVKSVALSERYSAPDGNEMPLYASATGEAATGVKKDMTAVGDEYKGEGTLIAVMDTALDTTHPAFSGDCIDMTRAKKDLEKIDAILDSTDAYYWNYHYNASSDTAFLEAENVYVNNKVVFAYDYGNKDANVLPYAGFGNALEHGTHTSGIAVGYDEAAGFSGIAPNAQLAFMKVFYEDYVNATVYSEDIYIAAAIEDSIMLGVDAINISLGAARGFSVDKTSENYIYQYCRYADLVGISVQASVGNSFTAAFDGLQSDYPSMIMPDYGAANSPATFDSTLAIGSYNGTNIDQYYALVNEGTASECKVYYTDPETQVFIDEIGAGKYDWVYVEGNGTYEDMAAAKVSGKIALVRMNDTVDAVQQMLNAQRNGAIAILFADATYLMVRTVSCKIVDPLPYAGLSLIDAEKLFTLGSGSIRFSDDQICYNLMSAFSSWGSTNTLNIKPEVVAVGGNVYSSLVSASIYGSLAGYYPCDYGYLSGSSMASPAATAYVAKLRQAFAERYPELNSRELTSLVSHIVMSTADTLSDLNGVLYSPRYQGAGAINYEAALTADEYLSVTGSKKPKIELGEDEKKTGVYFLNFNINNIGDESQTYALDLSVLTDSLCADGKTISLVSHELEGYGIEVSVSGGIYNRAESSITVAAGTKASVALRLTLTEENKEYLNQFMYGTYVEGFVRVVGEDLEHSVPFLAFYGDWEEAPLMDSTIYDDEEGYIFESMIIGTYNGGWNSAVLGAYPYVVPEGYEPIGYDERLLSIGSQTGGFYSISSLYVGLMRHADHVEFYIMDSATGEIYEYTSVEQLGRASYIESAGQMYPVIQGLSYGSDLPNNTEITITIRAALDNMGDTKNVCDTNSFRLVVDSEIPRFYTDSVGVYQKNGRTYLSVNVIDNNMVTSLWLYTYTPDGYQQAIGAPLPVYPDEFKPKEKNTLVYDITDYAAGFDSNVLGIIIEDAAMNRASYSLTVHADFEKEEEEEKPVVYATELTYNKTANVASNYSTDLGIKTIPANASYKLSVIPTKGYTGSAVIDEERQLVIARDPGYVRIQIESGDICVTSDLYVYVNDGEWIYEVVSRNNNWIKTYEVVDGNIKTERDSSFEYDPENGQTTQYYMVSAYRGEGSHVVIPKSHTDANGVVHEVVAIGQSAFYYCPNMLSVTIPNTIRDIGYNAFAENHILEELIFEENSQLRTINSFAFSYNYALDNVQLPKSLQYLDSRVFDDNTSLKNVTVEAHTAAEGASLLFIGSTAFGGTQVEEFTFPETLVSMGSAFSGTPLRKVVLPESLNAIASHGFSNCTNLEEVVLPSSLKTISMDAFAYCTSLKKINMPESLETIGAGAFQGCTSLTSVEIPDTVTKIGNGAFGNCTSLVSVKLGDGLKTLDKQVFYGAVSLRTVHFSEKTKIEEFGTDIFYGCINFVEFSVHPLNDSYMSDDGILYRKLKGTNCYQLHTVPIAKQITEFLVRPDVGEINDFAFAYHTELKTVLFPAGGALYSIGNYAFAGCEALETVGLQNATSLRTLGEYAFAYCVSLTDIVMPESLTKIPAYAFYYCVYLERVGFSSSLASIGGNAFAYCIRFEGTDGNGELKLPSSLNTIGAYAFVMNRQLNKVDLGDCNLTGSTNYWGEYAFAECTNVKEVILPKEATLLYNYIFYGCTSLEKINLEETKINNIRTYAFGHCTSLKDVRLPSTIRTIYAYAFVNTGMETLTIPDMGADGRIMSYAFALNTKLKELHLPNTISAIDSYTFAETAIKEVYIPKSLDRDSIHQSAFYLCSKLERFIVDEDNENFGVTPEGMLYFKPYQATNSYGEVVEMPAELFLCPLNMTVDTLVIAPEFTEIPGNFFQLTSGIRKIVVPNTVTAVGAGAFSYSRVEEVVFEEDSTIQMEGYSQTNLFDGCEDLKKVVLPDNLNCIPAQTFYGCIALEEVALPESVTVIYDGAFYGCESLKSIDLTNVEGIAGLAFGYCLSLEELKLGSNTNTISFDLNVTAFEGCSGLKNIEVDPYNETYKSIDGVLFDKSGSVLYVYPSSKAGSEYAVPVGVTKIAEQAFGMNKNLERVVLPETLAVVGTLAFFGTEKLDTYVFLSMKAPVLEGQYSNAYGQTLYANFLDISIFYFDYPLYLYMREGATGYDLWLYREFFYEFNNVDSLESYMPSPEQPIPVPDDNANGGGSIDDIEDYIERYAAYIEELKVNAMEELSGKLDDLKDKFAMEYEAFFDLFADDDAAQRKFYDSYVAEADKVYEMHTELYAARWLRIHEVINLIAELKTENEYSESAIQSLDTIAYSAQYILIRSNSIEEIETNYEYYKNFALGIPSLDKEAEFGEYLTQQKAVLTASYDTFLAEKSDLYDEDVLVEIETEYELVATKVAQAVSTLLIQEGMERWEYFLANVVTSADRAAFEAEKAEILAGFDAYKEDDYEYSLWLTMKGYMEEQLALIEDMYIIEDVRERAEFVHEQLRMQISKLDSRRSAAVYELDAYIEYYNMYANLYDANAKELRRIVEEGMSNIEAAATVEELATAFDTAFDRVWKYYEYNQKAYTEYRNALVAFEALSETERKAAMTELNAISYRVATNYTKITSLIEKYCGAND